MSGTNVSNINKTSLPVAGPVSKSEQGIQKKKESAGFSDFMSQLNSMAAQNAGTASTGSGIETVSQNVKDAAVHTGKEYHVEVKEPVSADRFQEESKEQLDSFAKDVKDVLKEELGVTEDEIEAAMQALGLTAADLTDAGNITALSMQLLGTDDISALLFNGDFQNVLQQIQGLTEGLCRELGISMEELKSLCEQISTKQEEMPDAGLQTDVPVTEEAFGQENTAQAGNNTGIIAAQEPVLTDGKENVRTLDTQTIRQDETQQSVSQQEDSSAEETVLSVDKESSAQDQTAKDSSNSNGQRDTSRGTTANSLFEQGIGQNINQASGVPQEEFTVPQANIPYSRNVDVQDMIDQISRNARVLLSGESTSMEMQLNPANLGKIYLHVTENEGTIHARLAAQTQVAKEALESQVADLKQNLNQQGIKVDSIEVTIASHEFEENLEQNSRQEEQLQEQREKDIKQGRRNLNLNSLDELSGLMTEEETLAAQIMQQRGNRIDYTA